jgi:hypothetical protein
MKWELMRDDMQTTEEVSCCCCIYLCVCVCVRARRCEGESLLCASSRLHHGSRGVYAPACACLYMGLRMKRSVRLCVCAVCLYQRERSCIPRLSRHTRTPTHTLYIHHTVRADEAGHGAQQALDVWHHLYACEYALCIRGCSDGYVWVRIACVRGSFVCLVNASRAIYTLAPSPFLLPPKPHLTHAPTPPPPFPPNNQPHKRPHQLPAPSSSPPPFLLHQPHTYSPPHKHTRRLRDEPRKRLQHPQRHARVPHDLPPRHRPARRRHVLRRRLLCHVHAAERDVCALECCGLRVALPCVAFRPSLGGLVCGNRVRACGHVCVWFWGSGVARLAACFVLDF